MSPQPKSKLRLALAAAALVLVAGGAGYGIAHLEQATSPEPPGAAKAERKVLYWYDPMAPAQHFDKPGKSPYMDMALTAKFADEGNGTSAAAPGLRIDAGVIQKLGVRLTSVESADFSQTLDVSGTIDFNQRNVAILQSRAAGFVERVHPRAPGDVVRAGAPIADILVPGWAGAQLEFLAVRRTGDAGLLTAARQRLLLLGMSREVISAVERDGRTRDITTLTAPIAGAIQTLDVRQGMTVSMGQTLAQFAGLSSVWLNAAIPEAVAGQLKVGDSASAQLAAYPEERFTGRVVAILPTTQLDSHTLTVRIELANPGLRLKPGMFAQVHLQGPSHPALLVPSEAVIRTGKRAIVMAADDEGRFSPVEVRLGRDDGHRIEILTGLGDGTRVVASGQFLIDSEASLAGLTAKPLEPVRRQHL
jgi:Cu(I)/Ag(I) efflux system membrane fusion protein